MQHLSGKVAIVTGSTGGIGRGIALRFALEGAVVMVTGRDAAAGQQVVEFLRAKGGVADFLPADVTSGRDMRDLVDATVKAFGQVDIMVASAAGVPLTETAQPHVRGIFPTLDVEAVAQIAARATVAKLAPIQAALPHMIERGSGSCLFVTSDGGRAATAGQTAVALYAGGLVMATKVLAKEMARHKVRVNCIATTLVGDSPSWKGLEGNVPMTELHRAQYERIRQRAPLGIASPEDIGKVAAFLVSDDAAFITGTTISPNGGLTIH